MPDPDSRLLKKVKSIGIVGRAESPNADDAVRDAVAWANKQNIRTFIESDTALRIGLTSRTTILPRRTAKPRRLTAGTWRRRHLA